MAADIVQFPHATPPVTPLAQFIRLGETSHKTHASLFAEGHLKAKRIVIDASRARFLKSEIKQFKEAGVELVLDTKVAELAAQQKFKSVGRYVPWAKASGNAPLEAPFFRKDHPADIYGQIARLAVEYEFDTVLAPGHFLNQNDWESWLRVDRNACLELRRALDREGGRHIAIDYLLITRHLMLNDAGVRSAIMDGTDDLPFDNLWIRASGFGNDAGAQPLSAFISALTQLHNLGKPIINDYVGGLVGEAIMALGGSSGFAHGIGELERFDAGQWHKPPKDRDPEKPLGRATRVPLGAFNKSFTIKELETMLSAKGAKRLFSPDPALTGIKTPADMLENPKVLASRESVGQFNLLEAVPTSRRAEDFLMRRMEPAVERARQIKNLTPNPEIAKEKGVDPEKLMTRMSKHHKKLGQQSNAIGELIVRLSDLGATARPVQRLSPMEERLRSGGSL
jgi:hypothetical protein